MKRFLAAAALALAACRREPPPPAKPEMISIRKPAALSEADERASLTNIARGATVISRTGESYLGVSAAATIDGDPYTMWINPPKDVPQSVVVGLPARARIDRVGFRTAKAGYTANQVRIEASAGGAAWQPLLTVTAAGTEKAQWFDVTPVEAAQLRLTALDLRADQAHLHINSVLARGTELEPPHAGAIDGCWALNGYPAVFARRGARVIGALALGNTPLFLDGGSDGRTIRFVWIRGNDYGLALATVSPDGKHLTALDWHEEAIPLFKADPWFGERAGCGGPVPRDDVAGALLRRVGRYSLFSGDVERLAALLRPGMRVVVHEFREATAQANKARAQQELERVRAALGARAKDVEFVNAGSENPRQEPVTEAMRSLYSSVDVEIRR